jgi:two-component system chemotaxis response regulator CheY
VNLSRFHILVVDDLALIRHIIVALLDTLGYTKVTEAEHGEHALELLRSSMTSDAAIDIVITDWNMPVMDGLALLKTIRSSPDLRDLPVLMITSETEQHNIAAALEAGVDGFIAKLSLSAGLLEQTLAHILATRNRAA